VPWEATVTYRGGTAGGPEAVLRASRQLDFFMRDIPDAWKLGVCMIPVAADIKHESDRLRLLVSQLRANADQSSDFPLLASKVNEASESLNIFIKQATSTYLDAGKVVGVLGGDHSTPLGLMRALGERHSRFGILQIDAHADLRKAYENFTYSHGSIMFNALRIPAVTKLIQVGVRDICDAEFNVISQSNGRIRTLFDDDMRAKADKGASWDLLCTEIIRELPEKVYVSFDIDGLDPKLCPNTGTPVPGGLDFYQATSLIKALVKSKRKIIGFDLCEVVPGSGNDWDANVGARVLWYLSCWAAVSNP
jgi:agmatinase